MDTSKMFLYFCSLIFLSLTNSNAASPEVKVKLGTIRGNEINVEGKVVHEFAGIPYARPPIGESRFSKPLPIVESWSSVLVAQNFSKSCVQFIKGSQSEDCLYLNIWNAKSNNSDLKPVMFWTHGGSFTIGSGALYNGSTLASLSDCIVVTYNYRLGPFGFLYGNTTDLPGNVALFDQLLALKWVHENIVFFGGNNSEITIFGQSAGAMSVSFHLISPLASDYYKRAIVMSGIGMDYYTADRKDWALKRAKALASVLGCNDTQNTFLTAEQIQCLRSVSVEKIMRAAEHPKVTAAAPKLPIDTPFLPIFGDEYIPIAPRIAWKTKAFKNDTELLIGTVYNETPMGSMIPRFIPPSAATEYQCRTTVPSQLLTMQECDELVRIYFLGIDEQRERPRAVETAMQLQTDVTFLCPSKAFAESFSEVNKVGQYFFLYKSKHDKIDCGPTHTCHMSDIPFTFAQFLSEEDREATLTWVNILSNFVKTGDTIWTNYHRTSTSQLLPYYLEFNGTLTATSLKLGLKHLHCEIWKSMVLNDNKVLADDTKFNDINEIEV